MRYILIPMISFLLVVIELYSEQHEDKTVLWAQNGFFHNFKFRLFMADFLGVLFFFIANFALSLLNQPSDFAVYIMAIVFIVIITYQEHPGNIILDHLHGRLKTQDHRWIDTDYLTEIQVRRSIQKVIVKTSDQHEISYVSNWWLVAREYEQEKIIFHYNMKASHKHDVDLYNQRWMIEMAHKIAEELNISVSESCGAELVNWASDFGDHSLLQYFEMNYKAYDGEVDDKIEKEFDISETKNGFQIKDREIDITWGFVIGLMLVVILFLATDYYIYTRLVILLAIFWFIFNINGIITRNIIEIRGDIILLRQKGVVFDDYRRAIKTEDLSTVNKIIFQDEMGIELVSKYLRIPLLGNFTDEDLIVLLSLVAEMIVST